MKTMLNIRKAKQVLQREPPASSPRFNTEQGTVQTITRNEQHKQTRYQVTP